jgi:DNA-binding MarR family transcriptional regulator
MSFLLGGFEAETTKQFLLDVSIYLYKYIGMSNEPEHLGWLIKRIQHGHHRALDRNLAPVGVSLVQWNALREIERNPGSSQHRLAERTFNSDQAFGTLMTRLQAAGLVERHPGTGRATIHRLTPKGKALLRDGQKVMSEVLTASFAPLRQQERQALGRLLTKVLDARRVE